MSSSYQHSAPTTTTADADMIFRQQWERDSRARRRNSLFLAGLLLVLGYLAITAGYGPAAREQSTLRGSTAVDQDMSVEELWGSHHSTSSSSSGSDDDEPPLAPKDVPEPDWKGEGRYDWQKCKDSSDSDCWKQEGERVHSYWKDFGTKMKNAWKSFREHVHDLFAGKKQDEEPAVVEEAEEPAPEESDAKETHADKEKPAEAPADETTVDETVDSAAKSKHKKQSKV